MSDPTDTVERMQACLCRWQASGDARAIFLSCYAMMTHNMLAALEAGEFQDARWVRHLLDHFAGYYFTALEEYDAHPERAPIVWRFAHEAAARKGAPAVQLLLLGVNAHINYDLILACADVLAEEWALLTPDDLGQRQLDFDHVNAVINGTIKEVEVEVLDPREPVLEVVDTLLGPVDEWIVGFEIARWRDEVWAQAVQRAAMWDAVEREKHREAVEAAALTWARRFGA